jgi:ketosteroid isomerase-like protein
LKRSDLRLSQIGKTGRSAWPNVAAECNLSAAFEPGTAVNTTPQPAEADADIDQLVHTATRAHEALMQGDIDGYLQHLRISSDFTLMAPFGGSPSRAATFTGQRWAEIGRFFEAGRNSTLELVQAYRSGDLAVLVAIERTVAQVGGLAEQPWALRVTLVFRHEAGQWQLAHRHADPLVEGISLEQAAALAAGRA